MEAKLATTLVHSVGAPDSDADDGSAFRDLSDVVRDSSDGERWDWIDGRSKEHRQSLLRVFTCWRAVATIPATSRMIRRRLKSLDRRAIQSPRTVRMHATRRVRYVTGYAG